MISQKKKKRNTIFEIHFGARYYLRPAVNELTQAELFLPENETLFVRLRNEIDRLVKKKRKEKKGSSIGSTPERLVNIK